MYRSPRGVIKKGNGPSRASVSSGVPGSINRGCSSELLVFTGVLLYRVREMASLSDILT